MGPPHEEQQQQHLQCSQQWHQQRRPWGQRLQQGARERVRRLPRSQRPGVSAQSPAHRLSRPPPSAPRLQHWQQLQLRGRAPPAQQQQQRECVPPAAEHAGRARQPVAAQQHASVGSVGPAAAPSTRARQPQPPRQPQRGDEPTAAPATGAPPPGQRPLRGRTRARTPAARVSHAHLGPAPEPSAGVCWPGWQLQHQPGAQPQRRLPTQRPPPPQQPPPRR